MSDSLHGGGRSPEAPDPPASADRVASEDRLRAVELQLAELRGEMGSAPRERLATLEAKLLSLATTTDLERAKRWVVVGLASAGLSILALVVRVLTWFFSPPSPPPGG